MLISLSLVDHVTIGKLSGYHIQERGIFVNLEGSIEAEVEENGIFPGIFQAKWVVVVVRRE